MKTLFIYLKSFLDFIILLILKSTIPSKNNSNNNLLFINTGQIGDLTVSSTIFECDALFSEYDNVYFLMRTINRELFKDYNGKIKILTIDIKAYKYNLTYRIRYNFKLRKLNIGTVYNVTSLRTTWNDSLALGIGAVKIYCFENLWNSLQKMYSERIDAYYTKQIALGLFNEYDRIEKLVETFTKGKSIDKSCTTSVFSIKNEVNQNDIILAPFSFDGNKDLKIDVINKIINKFKQHHFLFLCSEEQKTKLEGLKNSNNLTIADGNYKLNQLISIFEHAKIFIGVDSGLTHLALKTDIHVIAVIGMGNFGRYLPKPKDNETIYLFDECEYSGCEWKCKKERVFCVDNITVERINNEINKELKKYENP